MSESSKSGLPRWVPFVLVAGAGFVGWWLYQTGPVAQPIEESRPPKSVRTVTVVPSDYPVRILAYGNVIPARRVRIEPQVSGVVVRLHEGLRPGGMVGEEEELFAIDPRLAELDLEAARTEVARAEVSLAEAQRKWEEGQRLANEQVIPVTELASLESTVRIQTAELERLRVRAARQEELLARHVVRAPFNAVVIEESVEIGQNLDAGTATMTLVGTDEFWVMVVVPIDQLRWIEPPSGDRPGAIASIILDSGNGASERFPGEVIQVLSDLETEGRMARALIRVRDPLSRTAAEAGQPPLLLGSYVRVEIAAGVLENVLAIDRPALRGGDQIWVVDGRNRLQIRSVTVRWREGETLYIDPVVESGEKLIVSDLRVALPEMEVLSQDVENDSKGTTALP